VVFIRLAPNELPVKVASSESDEAFWLNEPKLMLSLETFSRWCATAYSSIPDEAHTEAIIYKTLNGDTIFPGYSVGFFIISA